MSVHIFKASNKKGKKITVTMGYDRVLDYLHCTVMHENGNTLYSNINDPNAGTRRRNVDYYRPILEKLQLGVPESVFEQVEIDQMLRAGNRVAIHTGEGKFEELTDPGHK